jgi:hypothetical protein
MGAAAKRAHPARNVHALDLLCRTEILPKTLTFKAHLHAGQRSTAELVDRYRLRCTPVRDALVRYLDERRPILDYASFTALLTRLVGVFWADIERHHPEINSLNLLAGVADAWKERIKVVTTKNRPPRFRKSCPQLLMKVRSFYLDIQEWAMDDPYWAQHAFSSPVRRTDAEGVVKHHRATTAAMHQRVRERLPKLPVLVNVAIENLETGEQTDLFAAENDEFWAWAIIETLRHTGIRHEELLEITHLALVSYRLAGTGERVPLLQILPSKNNQERLLLVGPDLASVLATIITRLRNRNGGTVPLVSR